MREVSHTEIMQLIYRTAGGLAWARYYPEIATGIERASNTDPLSREEEGPVVTACVLVADAWESSSFHPYTIHGAQMGLFQIRPPLHPKLPAGALTTPASAALIAVDLIRQSSAACARLPWDERLAWYKDLGRNPGPADVRAGRLSAESRESSRRILRRARRTFIDAFGAEFALTDVLGGAAAGMLEA